MRKLGGEDVLDSVGNNKNSEKKVCQLYDTKLEYVYCSNHCFGFPEMN